MSVYVDPLRRYPTNISCFRRGSSHLLADSLEELRCFARRLGMKRDWFQDGRIPHYDLTSVRRSKAVKLGAIEIRGKELKSVLEK